MNRIVERAVNAGRLRPDFRGEDFILITRGAMANMTSARTLDWQRHIELLLDGIRGTQP